MERGYTLLEMLIALAVLAIVTAFALPNFQDSIARNARDGAMLELMRALALARSEAVDAGGPVSVCRSADLASCAGARGDWSDGWLVFTDAGEAGRIDGDDRILRARGPRPVSGVLMLGTNTGSAVAGEYLRFNVEGFLVHPGAAFFMACDETGVTGAAARGVQVASSGRAAALADIPVWPVGGSSPCP